MADSFWITVLSIVAGAGGYLCVTFWFQPILRYREIKLRVASELVFFANAIEVYNQDGKHRQHAMNRQVANRRSAADLEAVYASLPCLYRRYLKCRNENPKGAATNLIELSNTVNWNGLERTIETEETIRKRLRLPAEPVKRLACR